MDYYDKVLAGMSSSLLAGAVIGVAGSFPPRFGVGAGSLLAIGIMYHGMFRNGPAGR